MPWLQQQQQLHRRHDIQSNDARFNDTMHKFNKHIDTQHQHLE